MSKALSNFNDHELKLLLETLDSENRISIEKYIHSKIENALKPKISDIWFNYDVAESYWLLLINGVDNLDESRMANELLFWKEFHAKQYAVFRCIQSGDVSLNKFCTSHFSITNSPTLLFSTSPDFTEFIKLDGGLLNELIKTENKLRNFVNKIHNQIINGSTIQDINKDLNKEGFWKGLKIVYAEIKGLLTVNINTL